MSCCIFSNCFHLLPKEHTSRHAELTQKDPVAGPPRQIEGPDGSVGYQPIEESQQFALEPALEL